MKLKKILIRRRIKAYIKALKNEWKSVSDLRTLEQFFAIHNPRGERILQVPDVEKWERVLVLAPHQDDELIGCGGLLLQLKEFEKKIHVCFITDGAQHISGMTKREVVAARRKEAEAVIDALGVDYSELGLDNSEPYPSQQHLQELHSLLNEWQPDLILLPWMLDAPYKHRLANEMLALIMLKYGLNVDIWGYQVHNHLYPNILVDITDKMEEKVRLLSIYKTQNENFVNFPHLTKGLNAYNSRFLRNSQYVEVFLGLPGKQYISLVQALYFGRRKEIYHGHAELAEHMTNLSRMYLTKSPVKD